MEVSDLSVPIREPISKGHRDLLAEFHNKHALGGLPTGELLTFNLGKNFSHLAVYNPAPVDIDGILHIWARVEEITDEKNSAVMLFTPGKNEGEWDIVEGAPVFKGLQDPFYCGIIDGDHVFGGVQINEGVGTPHLGYRTVFYRYKNSYTELVDPHGGTVAPFAIGPEHMKDIRLIQREKGRIGVFTRPQGGGQFGGRGRIGYFEIASLDELEEALAKYDREKDPKTLIQGLFVDAALGEEEWGGANQLFLLPDGMIGVLGHIAGFNGDGKKDYYPITFVFDPKTKSLNHVQIIATAAQFPAVEAKKGDLGSILFSGGLVRSEDGYAWLYVGIGDSKGGRIRIKDPFV